MAKYCFFIGRMNPIHVGHEAVIDEMITLCGMKNSTVILGSANAPTSMRQFFSYSERRGFIKNLYPELQVVGMADYRTDKEWQLALSDIIEAITGHTNKSSVLFFGGSEDDVRLLAEIGYATHVIDRFGGKTPVVSATQVRDHLLHGKSLKGLLDPKIALEVKELFLTRWEEFKKV